MQSAYNFCTELEPLVNQINNLLIKYKIDNADKVIAFMVNPTKIEPILSMDNFPFQDLEILETL